MFIWHAIKAQLSRLIQPTNSLVKTPILLTGIISVLLISNAVAEDSPPAGLVCKNNDYALCSHSPCGCFDENGAPTQCTEYPSGDENPPSSSWAVCKCPVVKTNTTIDSPYNFNYASNDLNCEQRADPKTYPSTKYTIPDGTPTELYSAYSYGDSLDNHDFGTKKNAESVICDNPSLFTDCLSMACYIPEGETHAICYCQNRSIENACSGQEPGWNTFGTNCTKTGKCQLDGERVWSAACIGDTRKAIEQIGIVMNADGVNVDLPQYCEQ